MPHVLYLSRILEEMELLDGEFIYWQIVVTLLEDIILFVSSVYMKNLFFSNWPWLFQAGDHNHCG